MASLSFPPIYLLSTHMEPEELHSLEEQIPSLTYVAHEADIILGKITMKQRAQFELRRLKLPTNEVATPPPAKRRKTTHDGGAVTTGIADAAPPSLVRVVKLAWFTDSVQKGCVLPVDDYLLYQVAKPPGPTLRTTEPPPGPQKRPPLLPETTSEHDLEDTFPPVPAFLHTTYSCQRPTLASSPNAAFVQQLEEVRRVRTLLDDAVGIRAYCTSIAAVAAYPHVLSAPQEVERLPGCSSKIGQLYREWKTEGQLREVAEARSDPHLSVLAAFYDIWGVGVKTAYDFYAKGWRDRDDVVEQGWTNLTRLQQIGIKYHDELQQKIPRAEVESIANTVLEHANQRCAGYQMAIVGGYRRGKQASGDVDVLISHPSEAATLYLIEGLVDSLTRSGHITHQLRVSARNSERGQKPLPRRDMDVEAGPGFDTLDKALVVWQDPDRDESAGAGNPHRRVDIIVSPWKTVGCALLSWTGATTFERDLRRYCKEQKQLRFDGSGIRNKINGAWIDLESGPDGSPAPDMLTAERRVFQGLDLEWRPPEERCTG